MRILIAAGTLLAMLQTPATAFFFERDQNAPWCLDYSFDGVVDCGFFSYRQCQETLVGVGGYCYENRRSYVAERTRRGKQRRY